MYSYKLYTGKEGRRSEYDAKYTASELAEMTTFQLRDICFREKLVEGFVNTLDRDQLISLILKFRGAEGRRLIRNYKNGGFERVERTLRKYLNQPLSGEGGIQAPARMVLYPGMRVDRKDGYRVTAGGILAESNVLLVNDQNELCGILNLIKDGDEPGSFCLAADQEAEIKRTLNRNYSLLFFREQDSDYLYKSYYEEEQLPPTQLYYYRIPVSELEIRELETTSAVLAIDFGTTNTTAGAYLDSNYIGNRSEADVLQERIRLDAINYVSFADRSKKTEEWIELLPTVIAVKDCSDSEGIVYEYGFDALKTMRNSGYSSHATVMHGLKRWVNDYTRKEEVTDASGNAAVVPRSELIRAYLLHVIATAEHQFKCRFKQLHISSPVKLKAQFLLMFRDILPEYIIENDRQLDEGMAVLFNTIADQIEKNSFMDGEAYKALVIDCGGGTTDLSSCEFRIEDGHISYQIDIHTAYENGDTNFGGNNITFRILQFMKIVFASYYRGGKGSADIDRLIDIPGNDIFRYVDEYGVKSVYSSFEAAYREAEEIIPTRFKLYENRTREEYMRVRNNFYFLWEMAEGMKKEFFHKTGVLRNRFQSEEEIGHESDLNITAIDRWYLSVMEDGQFKEVYQYPDVVFNIKEINHLIKADIYEIVRKFLDEFYRNGTLQDYSIIKLTGQSCRIDVFREALKEFVPGRSIEFKQKAADTGQVPELKLACLRGALRYISAHKAGSIEANIVHHAPVVPYSVTAFMHNRQERELIVCHQRLDRIHGHISRPADVGEVELFLKDSAGGLRHKYVYTSDAASYRAVLYEEIENEYGSHIPQEETDSIVNGEVKFFVFARNQHWGFHIVPVARRKEQLYIGQAAFFAFENDLSELDFFDGSK